MDGLDREPNRPRPLVSGWGLLGLALGVLVMLCLLLPASQRRQQLALEILPDALSLRYLDLSLARRPHDAELRLQVADKTQQAGQFEAARELLAPLATASPPLYARAQWLRLEIERKAWAAIGAEHKAARAQALARVLAAIDLIDVSRADAARVNELAELCWSLEQPLRAAELLAQLARRMLPQFEAHVAAAETAFLRADRAELAVGLHSEFAAAERTLGADAVRRHALRAVSLAQSALSEPDGLALAERLRLQLGADDPQLLAASLALAQSADIKLAFELAKRMLRAQPGEPELHRQVARLAEWNGDPLRALDEYVWLTRNAGRPEERARAISLARDNWDLKLLRELLRERESEPASTGARAPAAGSGGEPTLDSADPARTPARGATRQSTERGAGAHTLLHAPEAREFGCVDVQHVSYVCSVSLTICMSGVFSGTELCHWSDARVTERGDADKLRKWFA